MTRAVLFGAKMARATCLVALMACVKPAPPVVAAAPAPPVVAPAPAPPVVDAEPLPYAGDVGLDVVTERSQMKAADGRRVAVQGTVVRALAGVDEGTAVQLADGTRIFVGFGPWPHGWEYLEGMRVRVEGTLRVEPGGDLEVPILDQADAPLPAGVSLSVGEEVLQ